MAVEGEWAWPRCIGCERPIAKKRPRDYRYGMDVCCASCMKRVVHGEAYKIGWAIDSAERWMKRYRKNEDHDEPVSEIAWQMLAKKYALAWSQLRDHFQRPPFPAGLELFLIEIHNDRSTRA